MVVQLADGQRSCLFQRLGIFVGGFNLEAAEAICGFDPLAGADIIHILESLIDKSLVIALPLHGRTRYRMLETIREYAIDQLDDGSDARDQRSRHMFAFFELAKRGNRGLQGPEQPSWSRRLEAEHDNMRAAIAAALQDDPVVAVKMLVALQGFWILHGHVPEGRQYVHRALATEAVKNFDRAHAHALYVAAALANSQGENLEAATLLEQCLAIRRREGSDVDIAATLSTLAFARLHAGNASAARESELAAVDIFLRLGDRVGEAIGLLHLGQIAWFTGDVDEARQYLQRCLIAARQIEHGEVLSECLRTMGEISLHVDDGAVAQAQFHAALDAAQGTGDKRNRCLAAWCLTKVALASGQLEHARKGLTSAAEAFRRDGMRSELVGCVEDFAYLLSAEGRAAEAVRMLAVAAAARERFGISASLVARRALERTAQMLQNRLGDAEYQRAREVGVAESLDRAVEGLCNQARS